MLPELQQICGVQFGSGTNPGGHVRALYGDDVEGLRDCGTRTTMDDNSALPSCYYFVFTLVCNAKKELISHV